MPAVKAGAGATGMERRPSMTATVTAEIKFKVLMLGDSAVGKSCIVARSLYGSDASLDTASTMGVDLASKTLLVDHHRVKLQIWDTAGFVLAARDRGD